MVPNREEGEGEGEGVKKKYFFLDLFIILKLNSMVVKERRRQQGEPNKKRVKTTIRHKSREG